MLYSFCSFFFFFNDTATTEIYTLSLHDALPISRSSTQSVSSSRPQRSSARRASRRAPPGAGSSGARNQYATSLRSEEHTSEIQSRLHIVCRLLLEKKKKKKAHGKTNTTECHDAC